MRDRKLESARQSSSRSKSSAHDIQPLTNVKAFGKHVSPFNAALPRSIGKPLESVRVNIEPADKSGAEMLREKNKPVMNTTLSDSAGNFAMAGIVKRRVLFGYVQSRILHPSQDGRIPGGPFEIFGASAVLMQMLKPVVRRVPLHIQGKIDGSDELSITTSGASWRLFDWGWPDEIAMNRLPMHPHHGLKNAGRCVFLPQDVRLDSAANLKQSGRGSTDRWLQDDALIIQLNDPQNGAEGTATWTSKWKLHQRFAERADRNRNLYRGAIYPDYDKKSAALLLVLVSD